MKRKMMQLKLGSLICQKRMIRKGFTYHQKMEKIKIKYPNAYNLWGENEERILLNLFDEGKSPSEISKILKRQPGGIRPRLKKLGKIE